MSERFAPIAGILYDTILGAGACAPAFDRSGAGMPDTPGSGACGLCGVCSFDGIAAHLLPSGGRTRLPEHPRSVILMLFPYYVPDEREANISRYARVPDYHAVCGGLLARAAGALRAHYPGYMFAPFIDASPIPEVRAAARAGLGVIGCNNLLIHPTYGSWCFIGEIVTDLLVTPTGGEPAFCPACGACRAACPTRALHGVFDRTLCLPFILQKKNELSPREEALVRTGGLCWGCDRCQEACPLNRAAKATLIGEFTARYTHRYEDTTSDGAPRAWEWRGDAIARNARIMDRKTGHPNKD